MAAGSISVSPPGDGSRGAGERGSDSDGSVTHSDKPTQQRLRFRGLTPQKRYAVTLCTESNSGTLSKVIAVEADCHAEAPLVSPVFLVSCTYYCTLKCLRLNSSVWNEQFSPFGRTRKEK